MGSQSKPWRKTSIRYVQKKIEKTQHFLDHCKRHQALISRGINKEGQEQADNTEVAAWLLGPKGENLEILQQLVNKAIKHHQKVRQNFHPSDPKVITDKIKASPKYRAAIKKLYTEFDTLLNDLSHSMPFYSMRYQAHMSKDITLSSAAGYLAAMLYNQNNVAIKSSPVTTWFEMQVGNDLCQLLGYTVYDDTETNSSTESKIRPWGHIPADGSIANLEAMWAARNLKFYPVALRAALREVSGRKSDILPTSATSICVRTCSPNSKLKPVIDLSDWEVLNLRSDDILDLPYRLKQEFAVEDEALNKALNMHSIQDIGFLRYWDKYLPNIKHVPTIFVPATMHYSWPKSAAILGIGKNEIEGIQVDERARMDVNDLREWLEICVKNHRPVYMCVLVIGSTAESSVDPISDILALREEFRQKGLEFHLHVDAAWGGYFSAMLRKDKKTIRLESQNNKNSLPEYLRLSEHSPMDGLPMSAYVAQQYKMLRYADSITIDPHKAGFCPYPAGGLCYRNDKIRELLTFHSPVIYRKSSEPVPSVGIYGVEGSKSGAAAASVYLSHRVIPCDHSGYGELLSRCLYATKRFYAKLVTMADANDPFIVVTLTAPPSGVSKQQLISKIINASDDDIKKDPDSLKLLQQLGQDQNIISYAFNYKVDNQLNTDIERLNLFNDILFRLMSTPLTTDPNKTEKFMDLPNSIWEVDFFVTASEFDVSLHGKRLMRQFQDRLLGTKIDQLAKTIKFQISTIMDPWITTPYEENSQSEKTFLNEIESALRSNIAKARRYMIRKYHDAPYQQSEGA